LEAAHTGSIVQPQTRKQHENRHHRRQRHHRQGRRAQLAQRHEIIEVGSRSGTHQADMGDIAASARPVQAHRQGRCRRRHGRQAAFRPPGEFTPEQFQVGLDSKLMGQVNVALVAQEYLNDGGSITSPAASWPSSRSASARPPA
jgi:hypothetical protein